MKCIIILSNKSSGSSALQYLLAKFAQVNHVAHTGHCQHETLFWTKAASILELPQKSMVDSIVPLSRKQAKDDLVNLLVNNLDSYKPPVDEKELIFNGWQMLCEQYKPIFLEKSPHHLCQWSALELIMECMERLVDVEFCLIGLVRNPMDTIYSSFKRWKNVPGKLQQEWLVAYKNLLRLKEVMAEKLIVIRYEDMIKSLSYLYPVFDFCGVEIEAADNHFLHEKSVRKWRDDKLYGFTLSEEVIALAQSYGYHRSELENTSYLLWPVYQNISRNLTQMKQSILTLKNNN